MRLHCCCLSCSLYGANITQGFSLLNERIIASSVVTFHTLKGDIIFFLMYFHLPQTKYVHTLHMPDLFQMIHSICNNNILLQTIAFGIS